jgi:molecular chaperone GrpE (heat shock protein)
MSHFEEKEGYFMKLDEAIQHCEEKACENNQCSKEHKQLAEWLKELKQIQQEFDRYKKYVMYFAGKDKVNDIRLAMQDRELD